MKKIFIKTTLIFFLPALTYAGTWWGGGGDNIADRQNPWFLENVPVVKYCIAIDKATMSGSPDKLKSMTQKAIQDWKTIFSNYQKAHPTESVHLGTQSWVQENCQNSTDVQFKFGWGTLTDKEKSFLSNNRDVHEHIAEAVRTNYDKVHLKGAGFIYVASDLGPQALTSEDGQLQKPWQYPTLVYLELMHELGHVFGLPHLSANLIAFSPKWIMSERFPEMIMQKVLWQLSMQALQDPGEGITSFFEDSTVEACSLEDSDRHWFGVSDKTQCLRMEFVGEAMTISQVKFTAVDAQGMTLQQFTLKPTWQLSHKEGDISIFLPKEQTVFPPPSKMDFNVVTALGAAIGEIGGEVTLPDGNKKHILISKSENLVKIIGFDKNFNAIRTLLSLGSK